MLRAYSGSRVKLKSKASSSRRYGGRSAGPQELEPTLQSADKSAGQSGNAAGRVLVGPGSLCPSVDPPGIRRDHRRGGDIPLIGRHGEAEAVGPSLFLNALSCLIGFLPQIFYGKTAM